MKNEIVIDASEGVLGRVASYAAKQSLLGNKIIIVNCEKALITGRKRFIFDNYIKKIRRGGSSLKGPHFPRSSERIMKRTVRGMLPYKQERGRASLKRIICYSNLPAKYENSEKISLKKILKVNAISLERLNSEL